MAVINWEHYAVYAISGTTQNLEKKGEGGGRGHAPTFGVLICIPYKDITATAKFPPSNITLTGFYSIPSIQRISPASNMHTLTPPASMRDCQLNSQCYMDTEKILHKKSTTSKA